MTRIRWLVLVVALLAGVLVLPTNLAATGPVRGILERDGPVAARGGPVPSPEDQGSVSQTSSPYWTDFWSDDSLLHGEPAPVGATVDAYDPDGVHCGTCEVTAPGVWGVMHVYGDDASTPEDEGAENGDAIAFFIDGVPCEVVAGDPWWIDKALGKVTLVCPGCDDGDPCTVDYSHPGKGCAHVAKDCDDGNLCTQDSCDPATGECLRAPVDCNGNPCTIGYCDPQLGCVTEPVVCDDGNAGTIDSCNPAAGDCVHEWVGVQDEAWWTPGLAYTLR